MLLAQSIHQLAAGEIRQADVGEHGVHRLLAAFDQAYGVEPRGGAVDLEAE
jgi:hypothetical protein